MDDNTKTPLKANAFDLTDDQKVEKIEKHVESILDILGMDLTDDSISTNATQSGENVC